MPVNWSGTVYLHGEIDIGVHKLTGFTVEIEKYLITTKINSLVPSESMSQLLNLTMFVIVYLVIAAAAGYNQYGKERYGVMKGFALRFEE